jgi:hypothetical protein
MNLTITNNETINLVIRFLKNGLFYMQIWLPLYFIYKMIINKKTNIESSE